MPPLDHLYQPNPGLTSRSITFENPTGEPGAGGRAASPLGQGRKGDPARVIDAGETILLAGIEGPGTVRRIWMTTLASPRLLRGALVRCTWDDADCPSLELPLGEFFGFAHGATSAFQTALYAVGPRYGMSSFVPMPFRRRACLELINESTRPMTLFYQVDYTLGDQHTDNWCLHGWFSRQNPTTPRQDFELLPPRSGPGRFLGTVLGIRPLGPGWWGEGEAKFYLDGDGEFATLVGTGAEDYVGLSWGIQQAAFLYNGASRVDEGDSGAVSMYRWHLPDPLYWQRSARGTIQQIGHAGESRSLDQYKANLFERADDWSCGSFWYAPVGAPLPASPPPTARMADLPAPVSQAGA